MWKVIKSLIGKNWKGITAGIGLMLWGAAQGFDVLNQDILTQVSTWSDAYKSFMEGLGILGIRLAIPKRD